MNKRTIIYVIRQTQENAGYKEYAYEAYEDYDMALNECARLNDIYGNKETHFYKVDEINLFGKETI